ncbi:NADP-dependent oxidoreductase [Pedobacter montanisoli]|uniref:NADP-dependent oxidoreductase n=1 Tax=Pedobacter montanisoli TaxID=2923277 RepID=A0ABS9ZX04_9SPHI|nr:NADP-dependent oxidoreductase [Pedobacter montanisoli]MCJ0742823.1 NADP-dependent oxidoreductase [Pedobacter montanisoli]
MKAVILKTFGPAENLEYTEKEIPVMGSEEVLIQIRSISINPIDVKVRAGQRPAFKDKLPLILGWDIAGDVVSTGKNVQNLKAGDRVFGMICFPNPGNAYAEFTVAPAKDLALIPDNVDYAIASCAGIAALTALQALRNFVPVQAKQRVLVHAAAGGVGHFSIQLAKHFGAYVIGTASASNKDFVLSLGADECIDYKTTVFEDQVKDIDLVIDTIGGDYIERSLKTMKPGATIVSIPSILNTQVAALAQAQGKHGYPLLVKQNTEDLNFIAELLGKGILKPFISHVFAFDEMIAAHQQIESGKTRGKIVVSF